MTSSNVRAVTISPRTAIFALRRRIRIWGRRLVNRTASLACLWKSAASIDGIELGLPSDFSLNMRGILLRGNYEREELSVLRNTLDVDDVVLEFGTV